METVKFTICLAAPKFVFDKIASDFPDVPLKNVQNFIMLHSAEGLASKVKDGELQFVVDGKTVTLKHGVHFFLNARDMLKHKQ